MAQLDMKDKKILSLLDMDARMPLSELAKKVGLSRQVTDYRIRKMRGSGIIFGAVGIFDSAVVGHNWYRLILRFLDVTKKQKDEFIVYLKNHGSLFWLGEIGGNWDLVMNFICRNNFEFNNIIEEIISKFGKFILDYMVLIYISVYDMQRSYILGDDEVKNSSRSHKDKERRYFFHAMEYNPGLKLDDLDREIIKQLSSDALCTNAELGNKLGVSGNTIRNRIDGMKKNKLLLGFRLFINPSAVGYQSHMLFLATNKFDLAREKQLYFYLKSMHNITFIVKHIGKWRIGMEIETVTEQAFQEIFVDIRGRFSDIITDFESFPLFKDHKIDYFPQSAFGQNNANL